MYALVSVLFFDAGNGINSSGQAHFEQHPAASAQKTNFLRGAGTLRYWFNNSRPSRAPQGHVGVAG